MKKRILAIAAATLSVAGALALSGCAPTMHQAVPAIDSCVNCHSSDYEAIFTGGYSAKGEVVTTSTTIDVVVTGTDTLYICAPMGNNHSNMPIPVTIQTTKVTPGQPTTVTMSNMTEGHWMLVIQASGKVRSQMILVDPDATTGTVDLITLKL